MWGVFLREKEIELPGRIFSYAIRSAVTIFANHTLFRCWIFRLCCRCFARWTLYWWCWWKIAARFWLYMTVIHFHINDFHEFNLSCQLLNLLLRKLKFRNWIIHQSTKSVFNIIIMIRQTFNSSFSWYKSGESSGTKPIPFSENEAVMPRTRARWSHWSPWPRKTRNTFGPKTKTTVVVVDNWVLMNPKKYFTSGPACGNMIKLWKCKAIVRLNIFMLKKNSDSHWIDKRGLTEKQSSKCSQEQCCRLRMISFSLRCRAIRRFLRCSKLGCPRLERAPHLSSKGFYMLNSIWNLWLWFK